MLAVGKGTDKQLSLSDSHGDVVAGFDPADNTLSALSDSTGYDPFGKVTGRAGDTGSLGYQGDWTDAGTGQVDMGARWYDPNTGGFASRDSVDSTNRYGYAAANPVTNNDPTGQYCKTLPVVHTPVCVSKPKTSWLKKGWGWAKKGGKWGLGRVSLVGTIIMNKITVHPMPECTDLHSWDYCMMLFGNYPSYSTNARDQFCDTHSWTSQCGGNGGSPWTLPNGDPSTDKDDDPDGDTGPGTDDAAKRAAEERYRAWLRAKAISDHARAANEAAAKHTPIPVAPGATKPITLMPTPVSSSPKLPAGKVITTRDVVKDAKADAEAIYQNAVRAVGQLQQDVSNAAQVIVTTISALTNPYGPRVNNGGRRRQDCRQQLPSPNYMPVDSAHGNRATGVEACITQLSPDRNSAMYGPGYRWTQNYVKLNFGVKASSTINSCHLLASQFFGDGSRPENVATCSRAANYHVRGVGRLHDNMYRFESRVAAAVRGGQDVYYKVIPRYAGDRTVPVSFEVTAEGYYRDGRPGGINVHDVVPNILYNPRGRRGGTPGAINLGLLNDLNGRPAPVGNIR